VLKRVLDRARKERLTRILIDARPVDGVLSTFERYEPGKQAADYIKERRMNPRVAFVGEPPVVDGFGVRVAQNLGITVELFFHPAGGFELACDLAGSAAETSGPQQGPVLNHLRSLSLLDRWLIRL
jgi:hypothetical protein